MAPRFLDRLRRRSVRENVVLAALALSVLLLVLPFSSAMADGTFDLPPAWYYAVACAPLVGYAVYHRFWRPYAARRRTRRE